MSLSSPNMPKEKAIDHPVTAVVPPKKRRKPSADVVVDDSPTITANKDTCTLEEDDIEEDDDEDDIEKEQQQQQRRAKRHQKEKQGHEKHHTAIQSTPPFQPAMMALPPPLLSYPHHHQLAYYHPLYPAGPFYLPVGSSPPLTPHQPSPSLRPRNNAGARILPKVSPSDGNAAGAATTTTTSASATNAPCFASPPLHPNSPSEYLYHHHPFSIPIAPASGDPITASAATAGNVRRDSNSTALTTADQREQARKMSHSAIERRRRERINDKIVQLRQLIPSCANQEHLHKMTVLQSAIDYIAYLKEVVARLDGEESLNVNLKNNKAPKSMMPREVEAFTTQFSVTKTDARLRHQRRRSSTSSSSDANQQPVSNSSNEPSEQHPPSASSFDARKGIKPIDVIRARVPCHQHHSSTSSHGDSSLLATPVPSPSSVHSHEWSSATAPSNVLPPPWSSSTPNSDHVVTSGSSASQHPRHKDTHHDSSPETISSSWTEDGTSCSSPSLPTPSLTPKSGTPSSSSMPTQQKHMSVENLLC